MILDKLPNGFFKVDEVVNVLRKHTAKKPIFDLEQIANDLDYMQTARNFRLGVVKQKKTGEWYSDSSIYAVVETNRDLEVLKDEIRKTYRRVKGETPEPEKKVRKVTTQIDDLDSLDPQPRANTKSKAKYGESMKSGKLTNQTAKDI